MECRGQRVERLQERERETCHACPVIRSERIKSFYSNRRKYRKQTLIEKCYLKQIRFEHSNCPWHRPTERMGGTCWEDSLFIDGLELSSTLLSNVLYLTSSQIERVVLAYFWIAWRTPCFA